MWLRRSLPANESANELIVFVSCGDDGEEILARWTRDQFKALDAVALGDEIATMVQSLADEHARTIQGSVAWCIEGARYISRKVRAVPQRDVMEASAQPLDGTMQSLLAQNQRHMEGLARILVQGQAAAQQGMTQVVECLSTMIGTLEGRLSATEERLDLAKSEISDVQDVIREAEAAITSAEQAVAESGKSSEDSGTMKLLTEHILKAV